MKRTCIAFAVLLTFGVVSVSQGAEKKSSKKVPPVLNFKVKDIKGKTVDLSKYKGKVVLIVNVASECGYTPQYEGLQKLHEKFAGKGLAILGFPCNDYGGQEPGSEKQIQKFCKTNYGVTFDMFSKVGIRKDTAPLYQFLISKKTNPKSPGMVKWNFEKFLIGRDGAIVARFGSSVKPNSKELSNAISKELAQ